MSRRRPGAWAAFAAEHGIDDGQLRREVYDREHPARNFRRLSGADGRERLAEMVDLDALDAEMAATAQAEGRLPGTALVRVLESDAHALRAAGFLV
jgi:hypothetical protein